MEKIAKNLQLVLMSIILISAVIAVGIEIKNMLNELDLVFCGFETVDEKTKEAVSAGGGGPESLLSLDAWHNFEQSNPHYFTGMYTFWVQRPD